MKTFFCFWSLLILWRNTAQISTPEKIILYDFHRLFGQNLTQSLPPFCMGQQHCLCQGSVTYGLRADCDPPRHSTRPATFYCQLAGDLFSFFNDRYVAINRRNDSHLLTKTFFCSLCHRFAFFFLFWSPINSVVKRPEFLAKTFFVFGLRHQFGQKKVWMSGEDLSLLVRWNGGGPLERC